MVSFLVASAYAFCGAYVGPAGDIPDNRSSRVVVAWDGTDTTVTMTADARDVPSDFAMLVPVPRGTTEEDVRVLSDPTALDVLDGYSAPRFVAYTCDTLHAGTASGVGGCGGQAPAACNRSLEENLVAAVEQGFDDAGVDVPGVEHLGSLLDGDLTADLLDAATGEALQEWLDGNGYGMAPGADALLDNYIDQGVHFLAIEVTPSRRGDDIWVSPVQVVYEGVKVQQLPLRLGAVHGEDVQEVTLWVLSDPEDGAAAIGTYEEVIQEDDCMPAPGVDVAEVLEATFDEAVAEHEGAWVTEYSWPLANSCDPCPYDFADPSTAVEELGGVPFVSHVTRMRMRFTPELLDQDLFWQFTRQTPMEQLRYVQHDGGLEGDFPICLEGWVEDPEGICDGAEASRASLPAGLVWLLPLLGVGLRRRMGSSS
jgi:hypothetical protein